MKTFQSKEWKRYGNHYNLVGTSINVFFWNTGKNANFLVDAGYKKSNKHYKSFSKGPQAREDAINYALSIKDKYTEEVAACIN